MGKTTYNQARASRRKQFNKCIGGGLNDNEQIEFSNGTTGFYARQYDINTEKKAVTIKYYLNEGFAELSGSSRLIPEKVLIDGRYYAIAHAKIPKPKYNFVDWYNVAREKGVIGKSKQPVQSLEIKANVGVPLLSSEPKRSFVRHKSKDLEKKGFMKTKGGKRAH